jgi:hypothetical protein
VADLQLYTKALVYLESGLMSEEADVSMKRATGAQVVKTVAKGFSGVSPGAPMCNIEITNAVPSADFEVDPGRYMKTLQVVELTIFAAGRTATMKCFVTDDNFSHGVETPSKLTMSLVGQFPDWD